MPKPPTRWRNRVAASMAVRYARVLPVRSLRVAQSSPSMKCSWTPTTSASGARVLRSSSRPRVTDSVASCGLPSSTWARAQTIQPIAASTYRRRRSPSCAACAPASIASAYRRLSNATSAETSSRSLPTPAAPISTTVYPKAATSAHQGASSR
ncbi:hypothetical protein D7147_09925 [Micromonospora musae]|uniref:Uncharacterized protein n=1 Tax=Micromonospora musae TaxID=1894970 RepID=A0ABX9RDJ0_9ACTN|nr:hypothetical protein [Micromonospora musae]RKN21104.1 hypothetical protein D7147_09925 [Micromonospora musae]